MAADLGLLPSTQHQKLAQSHQEQHHQQQLNPSLSSTTGSWMWNSSRQAAPDEDDSWEVRAFAEDTGNVMGTTWPPRSYSCTFCRREFRSAQALGGHMNVHRRDRARLRHSPPGSGAGTGDLGSSCPTSSSSTGLIFPTQDFVTNGTGLCLLYPLPNPSCNVLNTGSIDGCVDYDHSHASNLLSVSPFTSTSNDNFMMPSCLAPLNFPAVTASLHASTVSISHCSKVAETYNNTNDDDRHYNSKMKSKSEKEAIEELDLELRLGLKP